MDRQALHARRFGYLNSEEKFEAEIPSDFQLFLEERLDFQFDQIKYFLDQANLWENKQLDLD